MSPTISVAMAGDSHGHVIAVIPSPDRYRMGERLVVGDVRCEDGQYRAWLWPQAGGAMRLGQHCDMVRAGDARALRDKLQKRADGDGAWWERGAA